MGAINLRIADELHDAARDSGVTLKTLIEAGLTHVIPLLSEQRRLQATLDAALAAAKAKLNSELARELARIRSEAEARLAQLEGLASVPLLAPVPGTGSVDRHGGDVAPGAVPGVAPGAVPGIAHGDRHGDRHADRHDAAPGPVQVAPKGDHKGHHNGEGKSEPKPKAHLESKDSPQPKPKGKWPMPVGPAVAGLGHYRTPRGKDFFRLESVLSYLSLDEDQVRSWTCDDDWDVDDDEATVIDVNGLISTLQSAIFEVKDVAKRRQYEDLLAWANASWPVIK